MRLLFTFRYPGLSQPAMAQDVQREASSNFAYRMLKNLRENPDKTFLVVDGEAVTGLEMHQRVSSAAHQLQKSGVLSGNRILITTSISVDFFAVAIAAFAIGACVVVLDPAMGLERANHCIATAKPSAWVLPAASWFTYLKYLLPSLRSISIHLEMSSLASSSKPPTEDKSSEGGTGGAVKLLEPDDCASVEHALVTFTTGSTGMPKLMLRKHSFVLNQSRSLSLSSEKLLLKEVGLTEAQTVYCTNLPMFAMHFLSVGGTCVLFPNITKCNPADVMDAMKKYGINLLGGSPAFIKKIATYAAKQNVTLPVKCTQIGGAPVFRGVFRNVTSVMADKKVAVVYGSTEVEPISVIFAEEKLQVEADKPDGLCVGRPVFENSALVIQILKESPNEPVDMADLELPRGQIGEIVVSGWHVNTYQVDSQRLIRDVKGDLWLRIEDAGYMDEDGRLWLVGRVKWRVEREGKTYWSTVVEQKVLDRCSALTFAAYLPHKGEAWLFLEAPHGLPNSEETALKQYLLREAVPVDHFIVQPSIPKDRRHLSKPNTAIIFSPSRLNRYAKLVVYLFRSNPAVPLLLIVIQLLLIFTVIFLIVTF